jgi:carboxypeptidase Q
VRSVFTALVFLLTGSISAQSGDTATIRQIYDYFLTQSRCYENLRYLTTQIGGRLSGSKKAADAVDWAKKAFLAAGADTIILQPCMVPHWVRGAAEKCELLVKGKEKRNLRCTALGSSVGTGDTGINAQVIEVDSFEELSKLGEDAVRGKIVFYNVFFNQKNIRPGTSYGQTVKFRALGASHAAKYGAIACIVRSMTSVADDEPHTGNMRYDTSISKSRIPAAALGYKSADILHDALIADPALRMFLKMNCETLPDVLSYNVIGQITGSQKPNEYIIAGGHLDSWDNGQGAHDDGAGVVQTLEMLMAFKKNGIVPVHSIRAVAFMNEENGLAGGNAYASFAVKNGEKHLAAIETDAGGYTPRGFGVDTTAGLFRKVTAWKGLFSPYLIDRIEKHGGGADLVALEKTGVPCIGFEPDTQRYFDIHHTAQDTFDKINKRELELGGAAISSLVYLLDKYLE